MSRIVFTKFQRNGEWSIEGVKWVEVRLLEGKTQRWRNCSKFNDNNTLRCWLMQGANSSGSKNVYSCIVKGCDIELLDINFTDPKQWLL